MDGEFFLLAALIIAGFAGLYFTMRRKPEEPKDHQGLVILQNQVNEITRSLDSRLGESQRAIQTQHVESSKIFREVAENLTKLNEAHRHVTEVSGKLENLENILKNPKQRGNLGEYLLETLLKNVFPPNVYQMQYRFKDNSVVDAAIFIGDKIIPVDSKFSLDNYNRLIGERNETVREQLEREFKSDLKKRIDETSKYIKPSEGTLDFAFMFIPAEGIYYDLLINQVGAVKTNTRDLIDYAFIEKNVHIVSPTNFLAYLKMVLQGMRVLQVEESAKDIRKNVEELRRHIGAYESYVQRLGKNLETTVNSYDTAYKELKKIDKDVYRITGKAAGIEPLALQKPQGEEVDEPADV